VLYWTGGHPYLTQRLCEAVARDESPTDAAGVDHQCEEFFLSPAAREKDDNLLFVRERLLRGEADLASLLDLYAQQRGGAMKTWPECRRRIEGVFAPFLSAPLATLTAGDLQMRADGWASKQSAAAAVRYVRPVLKSIGGAARISYAGVCPGQEKLLFATVDAQPASQGATGITAVRQIFRIPRSR